MPLSNLERQVLELVCREGKKCRGGVATPTVTRLLEPYDPRAVVGALHTLKSDGLLSVTGADEHSRGWMPTTKGEAALRGGIELKVEGFMVTSGIESIPQEGTWLLEKGERVSNLPQRPFVQKAIREAFGVPARLLKEGPVNAINENPRMKAVHEEMGKREAERVTRLLFGSGKISDDLLNRCAAMNATLLAQAEKSHATGDPDAWRDLAWLIETGKQLVAAGGGK